MNPQFEYTLVLLVCFTPPFLVAIFHPNSDIKPYLKQAWIAISMVAVPWIAWDVWATWRGHWGFNSTYHLGFKIGNLPLEEIAFFFVVPFCCLFIWTVMRNFESWDTFMKKLFQPSKYKKLRELRRQALPLRIYPF